MRVLVFGITNLAMYVVKQLVATDYLIVGLIFDISHNQDIRLMIQAANARKIPFYEQKNVNDPGFIKEVREVLKPDVILVVTFSQLLDSSLYSLAKIAAMNVHSSYLPDYRGHSPYFWTIANGEKFTGVTIHYLNDYFDEGDIISQDRISILSEDTNGMVVEKQKKSAWTLIKNVLQLINDTEKPPVSVKQSLGHFIKAPKLKLEDFFVTWSWTTVRILDRIRALNPFSAAFTLYRGDTIGIYQATRVFVTADVKPGTVISLTSNGPIVKTGDGAVLLNIVVVGRKYLLLGGDFVTNEAMTVDDFMGI